MKISKKKSQPVRRSSGQVELLPKAQPRTVPPKSRSGARVIVILGPTASGKTSLGINLAKKFSGEIISADSRQIYRGFDIGTAKPRRDKEQGTSVVERSSLRGAARDKERNYISEGVVHYLIDIRKPNQTYTVAQYKRDCVGTIRQILSRGKLPIIVGGTGLYIKAVVNNLAIPHVKADPLLRKELEQELQGRGLNFLYNELVKLDPEAAYIVDPHNPRRVIRALEIALSTKKPFSESRRQGKPLFDFLQVGVSQPKEKLRGRIDKRIDIMIREGFIDEVKNLIKKYPVQTNAFEAIGYREIISYLQKEVSLEEAIEVMKKNTWRFAKRQMTWFRKDKRIHWVTTPAQAEKLISRFLRPRA